MIQRIQTVYLILGVLALAGMFFIDPFLYGVAAEMQIWFTPTVLGLAGLAGVVALVAVFLYKDRKRQRSVIMGAQLITLVLLVALVLGLILADALFIRTVEGIDVELLIGLILPAAAYLLFMFARRRVTKDIELVRSMDRLR